MMIPGVDYPERFSPVASDESLRTQIAINLAFYKTGWRTMSCDIEATFLEAGMDKESHPAIVWCGFMTEEQRLESAILLERSIYGNVDAAIKFFKTLTTHLTNKNGMNMVQSATDPCLFFEFNDDKKLILIVIVTVDDCAVTGLETNIKWIIDSVEK